MKETEDCFLKIKNPYINFLKEEKIFNKNKVSIKSLKNIYIPLCFWIENQYLKNRKTLFLGFSGGQGAGKTTISKILKIILKNYFRRAIQIISIDDFYKTLKERKRMSVNIHQMFKTRGVPGTHDINLIKKFFNFIKKKKFKSFKIPKFGKNIDDRLKKKDWIHVKKRPDIVIFEGWCVGAQHQPQSIIKKPINILEKYQDKNMIWRQYVNKKLKTEYKNIFEKIDHIIFAKVPDYKMVFKWRLLQEKKLKKNSNFNKKTMSYKEIKEFIMYYQRITLQMIKDLSKSASVVMLLKKNHEIKKIIYRKQNDKKNI